MGHSHIGQLADEIRDQQVRYAQLRIGIVTETEPDLSTGHHRVRLDTTGDVWLQHDAAYHPSVGEKVYAIVQGPTGIVVGQLTIPV
jgi:hypothetical protein